MAFIVCGTCNTTRGRMHDPSARWWQFWKTIECPTCHGDGHARPPNMPSPEERFGKEAYREYVRQCKGMPPPPPLGGETGDAYFKRTGIRGLVPLEHSR